MKKLLLVFMAVFAFAQSNAQEKIGIAIYQDLKFLTIGDEARGYSAGTADVVAQFIMQGNQQKYGYMIIFPEVEYATIQGNYWRYSANIGYVFNELVISNVEVGASVGYGFIDRYRKTMRSWSLSGTVKWKLSDTFKLCVMGQETQRTDLGWLWGETKWKFSGFIGVEISIF